MAESDPKKRSNSYKKIFIEDYDKVVGVLGSVAVGSSDDNGSSNNEDINYYFDGDLNAAANRGSSADVSLAFKVYGQIFLSSDDFKKLDNLQKRGENNAVRASVKGFAVLTGMKDACAGKHEAMTDLYLKMPTFRMKYQGKVSFMSSGLDVMGGELGMIEIKGAVNLRFYSSETLPSRKKRYPSPDGGDGSGYMTIMVR